MEQLKNLKFYETELKMPLMSLPVRSVLVATKNGNVLLSPGSKITEEIYQSMPQVTDLVGPNHFHCSGVLKASRFHPNARLWSPLGGKEMSPSIPWTNELEKDPWPHSSELEALFIKGMPQINETVFFHPESRSLIVSDLCFNLLDARGIGAWIILNLFGTYRKLGVSKFLLRYLKDRPEFEASMKQVLTRDFENIVVGHGSLVLGNAKELLRASLRERGFQIN